MRQCSRRAHADFEGDASSFLPALAFDESTSQLRGVKSSNTEAEPRTSALVAAGSGGQGSL